MGFWSTNLNSNTTYYAQPYAQYFGMPNYFLQPYLYFLNIFQNRFGQNYYSTRNQNNLYNSNFDRYQNKETYTDESFTSDFWEDMGVNLKSDKKTTKTHTDKSFTSNFWEDNGVNLRSSKKNTKTTKSVTSLNTTKTNNKGSLNLSKSELAKIGFNTPDLRERWTHLKPEFQKALIKLNNYAQKHGIKISYNSTWRTAQEQIELYKKYGGKRAAKPGNSPHEKGIAVDLSTTSINGNKRLNEENQAILGAYWESLGYRWGGHFTNFTPEPWHFDLKPTRS